MGGRLSEPGQPDVVRPSSRAPAARTSFARASERRRAQVPTLAATSTRTQCRSARARFGRGAGAPGPSRTATRIPVPYSVAQTRRAQAQSQEQRNRNPRVGAFELVWPCSGSAVARSSRAGGRGAPEHPLREMSSRGDITSAYACLSGGESNSALRCGPGGSDSVDGVDGELAEVTPTRPCRSPITAGRAGQLLPHCYHGTRP